MKHTTAIKNIYDIHAAIKNIYEIQHQTVQNGVFRAFE